ncbi:SEC-C domain-containing protein [Candidatus Pacearchaeota archaeon]|nr:SEC-C domain-containing protein [Candidatus Pacearchaeota archaeon]
MKISNNAQCPCNSGEKYKKCCKGKLTEEQEKYYALLSTEGKIKDKLVRIVSIELGKDILDAYSLKFNNKHFGDKDNGFNPSAFFEWFFLEAKKEREEKILGWIVDKYKNEFNQEENLIIKEWINNTQAGIFEIVLSNESEWSLILKEIFNGREYRVKDRMASRTTIKGDIVYLRLQNIFGEYYISGTAQSYPRLILDQLKDYVNFYYENAKEEKGISYEDFMNSYGDVIFNFEPKRLEFITPSGDEMKFCEQTYLILDKKHNNILDWFDKNNNLFIITNVNTKGRKFNASIAIKAHKKEISRSTMKGETMRIESHFIDREKGEKILTQGSIDIKGDNLKLFTNSEESLDNIVKRMLDNKNGIGNYIKLIKEEVVSPEDIINDGELSEEEDEEIDEEKDPNMVKISKGLLTEYYKKWCRMRIPALGNKTPRQAIKTEDGKEKLKELLKDFDNIDLHKKREGELFADSVKIIREELGFYE